MKYKKYIFYSTIFALISVFSIFLLNRKKHQESAYIPLQKNSSCISCHTVMDGFSPSHKPNKISCTACHLGDNSAFAKKAAHQKMVVVPGNLSNVSNTCAKCHVGIDLRIKKSLMSTMSGIISIDKHVFGENKNLDSLFNIHHLKNKTKAESHLRNKCASCHLGNEKAHPNPITQKSRGGGCLACHLNYSKKAKNAHLKYLNSDKGNLTKIHPSISLKITDNHCFGCHSRSGRIATNYQGWHETIYRDTLYNNPNFRVLDDKRVFSKQNDDIHHKKGLSCIDCHDSYDVMGDGNTYAHQEQAVKIRCNDCHFNKMPKTTLFANLEEADKRILKLKKRDTTSEFLLTKKGRVMYQIIKKQNKFLMLAKNGNQYLSLSRPSEFCTQKTHKNISCSTCHTSWSPQCISCHTSYNSNMDGYDLLDKKYVMGKWEEEGNLFKSRFPTLGIVSEKDKESVKSFAIGMHLYLQKDPNKKIEFYRFFAPISPHTIAKKGADCKTCHLNPATIGYGAGKLTLHKNGTFLFTPKYKRDKDSLPKDAWIPFLKENKTGKTTRKNARPFSVSEQKRILRIGACLTCHKQNSKVVKSLLKSYANTLNNHSSQCILPNF